MLNNSDEIKLFAYISDKLKYMQLPDYTRISKEIVKHISAQEGDYYIYADAIISRLQQKEPWEYIRGFCEFCGNKFYVDNHTLIPRIETEQLVKISAESIINYMQANKDQEVNILDLGTGTGCIIISIEKILCRALPSAACSKVHYIGTDISKDALNTCRKNIIENSSTTLLYTSDMLDNVPNQVLTNKINFILSNPPYIPTRVYKTLDTSVINYEPRIALDGGPDGVKYYKLIKDQINKKQILIQQIYFEIDPSISDTIKTLFPCSKIITDCFGRERFCIVSNGF